MTCIIHEDICAECGNPVKSGTDNGTLPIPVGGQKVICLSCLCLCIEEPEDGDGNGRGGWVSVGTGIGSYQKQKRRFQRHGIKNQG